MTQEINHHPLLMDETGRNNLPGTSWHPSIENRYPSGSKAELFRRSQAFFYRWLARINGNTRVLEADPMQPEESLLNALSGPSVDIIAPTLVVSQNGLTKTVVILEDHVHQNETSFTMGKTTIVQQLLHLALVDDQVRKFLDMGENEKISADDLIIELNKTAAGQDRKIDVPQTADLRIKLLAGDVTFIGCSNIHKLVAMAMVGTQEDFQFDIARSGIRRLLKNYNRVDSNIMEAQSEITTRLSLPESVWADAQRTYPIDEIIFLTPEPGLPKLAQWEESLIGLSAADELYSQLIRNPIYIAGEIGYWDIDPQTHSRQVNAILNKIKCFPRVRYLTLDDPKNGYTLERATSLLAQEFKTTQNSEVKL